MPKLRPQPREHVHPREVEEIPPMGVRRLAAWSWRFLVIAAAAALVLWGGLMQVSTILVPVLLAVLLTVLLMPVVKALTRYTFLGGRGGAASGIALLGGLILIVAGMFTLAGRQLIAQWADIQDKAVTGFQSLLSWVTTTFDIDAPDDRRGDRRGLAQLQANADAWSAPR